MDIEIYHANQPQPGWYWVDNHDTAGEWFGPFDSQQAAVDDAFGDIMPDGYFTPRYQRKPATTCDPAEWKRSLAWICSYENGTDYAGPCYTPMQAYLQAVKLSES